MATRFIAMLGAWALGVVGAGAIVVDAPGLNVNEGDPGTGAPWANVGSINGASGIYLGNGWVLSAQHVTGSGGAAGSLSFVLGGTTYHNVDSVVTLTNPDGSASDLTLFNIGASPAGLSSVNLLASTVAAGSTLTLIGYGEHASGGFGTVSTPGGNLPGYALDGLPGRTKGWGYATVTDNTVVTAQASGHNAFQGVATDGFAPTGSSGAAQAEVGDSGGGAFVEIAGVWYLAGTINGIDASAISGTNVYGAVQGDDTVFADISAYAAQIDADMAAAPEPGVVSLLGAGGLGAAWSLLRRRRRAMP